MKVFFGLIYRLKFTGRPPPADAGAPVFSCAFGLGLTMEAMLLEVRGEEMPGVILVAEDS